MRGQGKKLAALAYQIADSRGYELTENEKANPVLAALFAGPEPEEIAYLWPDCVAAWGHWCAVQSQWRYSGMGGATGLDYAGVRAYLDEQGLQGEERRDIFNGIRAAESATREAWRETRKQTG